MRWILDWSRWRGATRRRLGFAPANVFAQRLGLTLGAAVAGFRLAIPVVAIAHNKMP